MPGIWNINGNYDINTKKLFRKLSFEVGQVFLAKVEDLDKLTGEILLKMLDGWQFAAKLEGQMDKLPEGLIKFQVDGYVDGKLQIKLSNVDSQKKETEGSIETLLKERSLNLDKEDFPLLDKMVKHNIPLTKENISNAKTFMDFIKKLNNSPEEGEAFINKYLDNKGILSDSPKAQSLKTILRGFFNELKNMSSDEILTFIENNIDLTEDNIKSFNNMFKESGKLYSDIKNIDKNINKAVIENKEFTSAEAKNLLNENESVHKEGINKESVSKESVSKESVSKETLSKEAVSKGNVNEAISNKDTVKNSTALNDTVSKNLSNKNEASDGNKNVQSQTTAAGDEKGKNPLVDVTKDNTNIKTNGKVINKSVEFKQNSLSDMAQNIKDQIAVKTDEIKNVIKSIIETKVDLKSDIYNNISQILDKSINDFKVFNSVSDQYYYLDLPINMDDSEYQCKLMIKDERKKGKKIDSTNVKIAASVNTANMGVVDAYIKVNNFNMDVDIKCEEMWIKFLDRGKDKMLDSLSDLGYNIFVRVEKKEIEMDIVNCREFFEDASLGVINTKV